MILTKEDINEICLETLRECLDKVSLSNWVHKPKRFKFMNYKRVYGRAHWNGLIEINEAYIGSEETESLISLICHELAHLCVGNHNKHNPIWKGCYLQFLDGRKAFFDYDPIDKHIKHKYTLKMILWNGKEIIQQRNRRNKKYSNNNIGNMHINGSTITEFIWIDNKTGKALN